LQVGARPVTSPQCCAVAGGNGVDKLLDGSRPAYAIRRSEIVGHRSRGRDGVNRILHRSEDDLSPTSDVVNKRNHRTLFALNTVLFTELLLVW